MSENVESTDTIIPMEQFVLAIGNTIFKRQISDPQSESGYSYKSTFSQRTSEPTPLVNGDELTNSIELDLGILNHNERRRSSELSTISFTSNSQELINPPTTTQNMFSHLSSIPMLLVPQSAPVNGSHTLRTSNTSAHTMSRREIAELQLNALLNDRTESLPACIHEIPAMSLENISKELHIQPFILERLLKVTNSLLNNDESSSSNENNIIRLTRALNGTSDVRVLLFFMMLDENNNKHVSGDELKQFLEIYFQSISFSSHCLPNVVQAFLQKFHLETTQNQIDFEEFYSILTKDVTLLELVSRFTIDPTWYLNLKPSCSCSKLPCHKIFCNKLKSKLGLEHLQENPSKIVLCLLYILINLALVLYIIIYRTKVTKSSVCIILARIGGILLAFNCSLIVVPMFKQTILFIRSHKLLRRLIPVDSHIDFHKFVGRFIAVLAILHTMAHMINFALLKESSWAIYMFTTKSGIGWIGGFAPLSGIILCLILTTMVICSMEWIREKAYFEVFYWTHTLYVVFFIFLIIHAGNFWKWAVGPLSWLFLEKLYSFFKRYSPLSGVSYLISTTIEKSDMIKLTIHRPKNFTFKPGDYISINLPSVALYEFHPFTISSAPEQTDILQVHIHAKGNWTKRVYQRFLDMSENNSNHEVDVVVHRADRDPLRATDDERNEQNAIENKNERNNNNMTRMRIKKERVIINGPYSSCARYVFDCEHVILISSGIGVTPYASILSSLMAQFHASRTICQHCQGINYHKKVLVENRRIQKVDFIWVIKDYRNFQWFIKLLHQLEKEQEDYLALNPNEHRFLTIHLYFTGMKNNQSIDHYLFELITQISAQTNGKDIFTGLKSRTHLGRPIWDQLFTQLKTENSHLINNDVNVFFCGLKEMGKDIYECSTRHHFRYYEEIF